MKCDGVVPDARIIHPWATLRGDVPGVEKQGIDSWLPSLNPPICSDKVVLVPGYTYFGKQIPQQGKITQNNTTHLTLTFLEGYKG
jgi:hypothetical protein